MPTRPAKRAEDVAATVADSVADTVKSVIERLVDAELTREIARRGQDLAGVLAERGTDVGERASGAWRETEPMRRDAAKRVAGAGGDAAKWSDSLWRGSLAPALRDIWKRRTVAVGAATAAVPAGRELVEAAAVRLGMKERQRQEERRRWGLFFLGLALGAIAGAAVALLTTPKRGSEVRRELGVRADEVRRELGVRADEIATRAREAEWMPVFQREDTGGNGHADRPAADRPAADRAANRPAAERPAPRPGARPKRRAPSESLAAGAADAGTTGPGTGAGTAAERAADDTAEAINEAYDVDRQTVDRESPA